VDFRSNEEKNGAALCHVNKAIFSLEKAIKEAGDLEHGPLMQEVMEHLGHIAKGLRRLSELRQVR
jgi:hypothetical protein